MPIRVQRPARGGEGVATPLSKPVQNSPRRIACYDPDVGIDDDWRGFLTAF